MSNQLPPSLQVLLQKQQEHSGLQALKEASDKLVERVDKLSQMSNVMADGGQAIGSVLSSWPYIFSVLQSLERPPAPTDPDVDDEPIPQMVRLPYTRESEEDLGKQ